MTRGGLLPEMATGFDSKAVQHFCSLGIFRMPSGPSPHPIPPPSWKRGFGGGAEREPLQHLRGRMPLLHREHAGLCHMEGNKNCFPPLTKVNNMAALPIALLRLTFLWNARADISGSGGSWNIGSNCCILFLPGHSVWFERRTSSRLGRPFSVVAGGNLCAAKPLTLAQASPCSLAQADICCMAAWVARGPSGLPLRPGPTICVHSRHLSAQCCFGSMSTSCSSHAALSGC